MARDWLRWKRLSLYGCRRHEIGTSPHAGITANFYYGCVHAYVQTRNLTNLVLLWPSDGRRFHFQSEACENKKVKKGVTRNRGANLKKSAYIYARAHQNRTIYFRE